jgi:hypothetical protein
MGYRHGGVEAWYDQDGSSMTLTCTYWQDTFLQALRNLGNVAASRWDEVLTADDHGTDRYVATLESVAARPDRASMICE